MSSEALAYILENGFYVLLYIPNTAISGYNQFLSAVFGSHVDSVSKIQPELVIKELMFVSDNNLIVFFVNS